MLLVQDRAESNIQGELEIGIDSYEQDIKSPITQSLPQNDNLVSAVYYIVVALVTGISLVRILRIRKCLAKFNTFAQTQYASNDSKCQHALDTHSAVYNNNLQPKQHLPYLSSYEYLQ